jgi:hypothetical protein
MHILINQLIYVAILVGHLYSSTCWYGTGKDGRAIYTGKRTNIFL